MRYNMRKLAHAVPAAMMVLAATSAIAATAKDIVAARQARYKEMGAAFKVINDQLKASAPDVALIKTNAATVTRIGQLQNGASWFPAGTQSGQGLQTAAGAAIWKNPADFNAKRADLAKVSSGYAAIAAKGDVEAIRAATGDVGKSCKACHSTYRDEDKS